MANYLTTKFKGTYRILPDICLDSNDFARNEDDSIDEDMVYISCQNGNKIWYWGLNDSRRGMLGAYIPSLGRGRNIKKAMKKDKIEFFDYDESDEEVMFKFLASDVEAVAELMKAKTSGANISPFSTRNLPKSDVTIPTEKIEEYKTVTASVGKSDMLLIKNLNERFLADILEKSLKKQTKNNKFSCREDMKKLKMSRQFKEYVYHRGAWGNYISYLDEEIKKHYNNK